MKRPSCSKGFVVNSVNEVLIEVRPGRLRSALTIDGRLVQMIVEDESEPSLVGNIYLGRVEKVIESLNACFVDLGLDRSGFLAMPEVRPVGEKVSSGDKISKYLCEGDKVCVQIQRDSFPGDNAIKISHRIDSVETRSRLKSLLNDIAGQSEGFIVRTAAETIPNEDIIAHVEKLREEYLGIKAGLYAGAMPSLLHGLADGVIRALRDWTPSDVNRIIIDDIQAYLKAKKFLEQQAPALLERLSHHKGPQPLFQVGNLVDDLEQALGAHVDLPSGGSIIISETAALIAVDVNVAGTSKGEYERSILETNLEACAEIARQIRLRNLSGLLVVDFVSMKNRKSMNKVLAALKLRIADDPEQVFVAGFTHFGLVEMTRKRSRPSIRTSLGQNCLKCEGSGLSLTVRTHGFNALDRLRVEGLSRPSQCLELRTSKAVAACFDGQLKNALSELRVELGIKITIRADTGLEDEFFDIIRHVSSKGNIDD